MVMEETRLNPLKVQLEKRWQVAVVYLITGFILGIDATLAFLAMKGWYP